MEAREGRTQTEVLEGRVAVNARDQRGAVLPHGFGAVVVPGQAAIAPDTEVLPLPFHSGEQLLAQAAAQGGSIAQVMRPAGPSTKV